MALHVKKRWAHKTLEEDLKIIGNGLSFSQGELEKALKEKVIEKRNAVFEKTKEEVAKRVKFEDIVSVKV